MRNLALDLFRGSTVLLMVVVNNPGSWKYIYSPLRHASWNGLSIADLVFPFFLLAVGMSIPLANSRRKERGESNVRIFFHVTIRSLFLVLIGLALNGFPDYDLSGLRIPGVLQRIGLVYFFTYCIFLIPKESIRIFLVIFFLVSYYYIICFIPPPDWSGMDEFEFSQKYNYAGYIDRLLMNGHLWIHTKTWDPEGLLSTIPAITSGVFGLWAGIHWIQRSGRLFCLGFASLVVGLLWNFYFPINKSLWTSSFVLVTTGLGYLIISILVFYFRNQEKPGNLNSIIASFGRHALFVFVYIGLLSRILTLNWGSGSMKSWIWTQLSSYGDPYFMSLIYSVAYLIFVYVSLITYSKFYYIWNKKRHSP